MTDTDFDPWDTVTTRLSTRVQVGSKSVTQSLHKRATQRIPDVRRVAGRQFVVMGNDKFNDTYPQYDVTWLGGDEYECSCYSLNHGDTRARNSCSHVVAVMLYREQVKGDASDSTLNPYMVSEGGNGHHQLSLPSKNLDTTSSTEELDNDLAGGQVASVRSDITVPSLSDHVFTAWDTQPLPSKFQELRPHQWNAIEEIVECYRRGVEVVFVDGPVGTGKTLIAECVRRLMEKRAFYICHSLSLQAQFANDFPYAKVLKGRSNYPTLYGGGDITCADCTSSTPDDECMWCDERNLCPYQIAKSQAIQSKLAVLNTAYFLTEFNYVGNVGKGRELGIIDEVDVLEGALMSFVEFKLSERMLGRVGLSAPKEGSHYKTLGAWLVQEFKPRLRQYMTTLRGDDVRTIREKMSCVRLMADVMRIEQQIEQDETLGNWVRDNKSGPFVLKPVTVGDYGDGAVWKHAERWLCMSATIISPDELSDSCGLQGGDGEGGQGRRWELVRVPMTFPKKNRPIILAPVADMSKKGKDSGEWEHAATALRNICLRHPNDRILVHTVSYELARFLMDRVARTLDRPFYTYGQASSRDLTLAKFRRDERAVLVAASMDRGVDLADEECRVVVVAKVPFPYLGDSQVSKRMRMPGGQQWYAVQAVRKLVQMTGRAVRHEGDHATCYVLDKQMVSNVLKKHKGLLPAWWQEAIVRDFPIRELLK